MGIVGVVAGVVELVEVVGVVVMVGVTCILKECLMAKSLQKKRIGVSK